MSNYDVNVQDTNSAEFSVIFKGPADSDYFNFFLGINQRY